MSQPVVSVILLNYNKAADTLTCLESLYQSRLEQVEIVVVDNGSTDGSVERIRSGYPAITLIENGENLGYAEGNNAGIRCALEKGSRYLFVLNNDTRVAADTLDCLVDAAERFPNAAFFGPKILHLDDPGRVQSTGIRLDHFWQSHQMGQDDLDRPAEDAVHDVDCVTGAALFIRAEALAAIGLLDPQFYLYREDIDWCLRAQLSGFRILFVPHARVWHRSHHVRESDLPRITYYMTRNSLLLVRKHHGGFFRFAGLVLLFLRTALSWTVRPRWRSKRQERDALLQGLSDYFHGRFGRGHRGYS